LEYLSNDDVALLRELHVVNEAVIDNKAIDLASRTIAEVIIDYDDNGEPYPEHTYVGFPSGDGRLGYNPKAVVIAFMNALVLANEYEVSSQEEELYLKRSNYLLDQLPKAQVSAEKRLGLPVMLIITEIVMLDVPDREFIDYVIDSNRGIYPEPPSH
jgi:hypothetical protein